MVAHPNHTVIHAGTATAGKTQDIVGYLAVVRKDMRHQRFFMLIDVIHNTIQIGVPEENKKKSESVFTNRLYRSYSMVECIVI